MANETPHLSGAGEGGSARLGGGASADEKHAVTVIRRLLTTVNQRTACGCDELFSWWELADFALAAGASLQVSAKLAHLQQQLVCALHQHFRKRWPVCIPDWSPEEIKRGLDRPSGNRALNGHVLDLAFVGVPYINASAIPALAPSPLSYIATQHPMSNTVGDFWRMVLAVQPVAIVMLNGMPAGEEITDLAQYWLPSAIPDGNLKLTAIEEESHEPAADVTVRSLRCKLHDMEWCGSQIVVSWWRDQSEPPSGKFLALAQVLNHLVLRSGPRPPPVIVHCAAGIGRAGVFIAADCGARSAAMGGDLEKCCPDRLVQYLRQCRQNMVQTAEQYEFLHTVLPPLATQLASELAACDYAASPSSPSPVGP